MVKDGKTFQHRIFFSGPTELVPCNALKETIADAMGRKSFGSLMIVFSSDGGDTHQAVALYHFFRALPVPVHIHATGFVSSAAIPAFLGGHTRTCSSATRFMTHAVEWNLNGSYGMPKLADVVGFLNNERGMMFAIAKDRTTIPEAELAKLYAEYCLPYFFDASKALEWSLVSDITEINPKAEAQEGVIVHTVSWPNY